MFTGSQYTTISLDNATFKGNKANNGDGGAILSSNSSTGTIKTVVNSTFENNTAGIDGGALGFSGSIFNLIEGSTFKNNYAGHEGGAFQAQPAGNYGQWAIVNSTFEGNYTGTRGYSGNGGAINIWGNSTDLETLYIKNSTFKENKAVQYAYANGGGIFMVNTPLTVLGGSFSDNEAGWGGALFVNSMASLDIITSLVDLDNPTGNTANEGGFMYSANTDLNIFANTKNVTFEGNIANFTDTDYNAGQALYFEASSTDANLNLNASEGKKLIFNDTIAAYTNSGAHTASININKSGLTYNDITTSYDPDTYEATITESAVTMGNTGEVQLNNRLGDADENFTVNLYGGTLSIGQNAANNATTTNPDGWINDNKFAIKGDAILNTVNGIIGEFAPTSFNVDSGVNWEYQFDIDLENEKSDKLVVTDNSGNLQLSSLNIISDSDNMNMKIVYSDTNINGQLKDDYTITTSSASYDITAVNDDTDGSYLNISKHIDAKGLAGAIAIASDVYSNTSGQAENVESWVGTSGNVLKSDLIINGNNQIITTENGLDGIVVNSGLELTVNNVSDITGFSEAFNNEGTINLNNVTVSDAITGTNGVLNLAGVNTFNNSISGNTINLNNSTLNLGANADLQNASFVANGGVLNLQNNGVQSYNLGDFTLNSDMNLTVDGNLGAAIMDTISANSFTNNNDSHINISNINILQHSTLPSFSVSALGSGMDSATKTALASAIQYTGDSTIYSPVYKYDVAYDPNEGLLNFTKSGGGASGDTKYGDINPAVTDSPVAAQVQGYLTQLNSYDEAFRNMDLYMLNTYRQRSAMKMMNRYASSDLKSSPYKDSALDKAGVWSRTYTTFEKVPLKNGPKVSNIAYGTFIGQESPIIELGNGWDWSYGGYISYNGSHQNYDGVSIYQNGGTLGAIAMAYKGNFFSGLTVNAGANGGEGKTMYGTDDFSMLMAGVASKSGYNFEFLDGRVILQPSWLMSYSFVNTFDYTNAAGVRITSDPLHAIQLQPEVKLIGNYKNGLQTYANVAVIGNIMDKVKYKANDVSLPEISVKPFVKYGVGIRKTWGQKFTGFLQAFVTNGGRNGVGLQVGLRWTFK